MKKILLESERRDRRRADFEVKEKVNGKVKVKLK